MLHQTLLRCLVAVFAVSFSVLAAADAAASVGYLLHGQGFRYKALSGAGVALHLDPSAASLNPGAMAFVPRGYDVSIAAVLPRSGYTVTGEPSSDQTTYLGLEPGDYTGDANIMVAPVLSANWCMNQAETLYLGLTVLSRGGMKTEYAHGVYAPTARPAGIALTQMTGMPTLSCRLGDRHGIGVSPLITVQRYGAQGLQPFAWRGWSSDKDNLTNRGTDTAIGYGARVGYLGEWFAPVSVGASYQTRTSMSASGDYSGWLAEQGIMDNPASWTAGVAFSFDNFGFAADVQQVFYSDLKSLGNPMLPNLEDSLLGDDLGAGSGWKNTLSLRSGAWFQFAESWMARAGFATGDHPVADTEIFFNILSPQVSRHQVSLGLSRRLDPGKELGVVAVYSFENTLEGGNPLEAPGAQTLAISSSQWELGLGLSF